MQEYIHQGFHLPNCNAPRRYFNSISGTGQDLLHDTWEWHWDDVPHISGVLMNGAVTAKEARGGGVQDTAAGPLIIIPV